MTKHASVADAIGRLCQALQGFEPTASLLELPPLADREWHEVLTRKLRPQLGDESFLIAAVVGGTNIGKSVIFNHVAGFRASATSPLASGTRHPTCLAPVGFRNQHHLEELFSGFTIVPWERAEDALNSEDTHYLYWRESDEMRSNLLVLDTPDIDSDARINWERADHVRQCADVLIAVLTQQKYNDAAVKEFFRKAAKEDKAILLVVNQLLLPEDEQYWPLWVKTFCEETGVRPEAVYVAPNDRRAAEQNQLPFYERNWPVEAGEAPVAESASVASPRSLLEDLSRNRFREIKWRSLRGSVRQVVDRVSGVPAYLASIRQRCEEFRTDGKLLGANKLAMIREWPVLPAAVMIAELRRWWSEQRVGWSRTIHESYNKLGQGLSWSVGKVSGFFREPQPSLIDRYRQKEWDAVLIMVESVYSQIETLTQLGNPRLQEKLKTILKGTNRASLINVLKAEQAQFDFQSELRDLVDQELKSFQTDKPGAYESLRKIDSLAAVARPATSVALFCSGFGPVGHALGPMVTDAAMQGAFQLFGNVLGGTVTVAVGETMLGAGASTGVGYLEAKFRQLETRFTQRRAAWVAQALDKFLLGSLLRELKAGATVSSSPEFLELEAAVAHLALAEREASMELDQPSA